MLKRTELSDMDWEQLRKIKRNGNYGAYGSPNGRLRDVKDKHAQVGKGKET